MLGAPSAVAARGVTVRRGNRTLRAVRPRGPECRRFRRAVCRPGARRGSATDLRLCDQVRGPVALPTAVFGPDGRLIADATGSWSRPLRPRRRRRSTRSRIAGARNGVALRPRRRPLGPRRRPGPRVEDRARPDARRGLPRATARQRRVPGRGRARRARPAARDDHDHRDRPPGLQHARLPAPGANGLAFGRDGTLYIADTARGDLARLSRPPRRRPKPHRLRHDVHPQHPVPRRHLRPAPVPGRRRRHRDRRRRDDLRRRQRTQRGHCRDREGPRRRVLPQRPGRDPPAQRRPARVPDEPGPRRPQAVPDPFGRRAPRQFPQRTRRRGKGVLRG